MPIHVPSWLRKSLNPNQIIDAFDHYGEKVIDWASREGGVVERALITSGVAAARPLAAIADQLTDAGMPAVNLYYGEKYNPFTLKRYRSADPFTQKGGIVKRPRSQLPAQPKRDMPFGNKRRRDWDQIQRSLKFPRRMAGKRSNSVTGHYRKSKRRKRVQDPRGVVNVYDDHDNFTSDNALYVYTQDFGSSDRAITLGVQAILKAALATIHIYPTNPSFAIFTGSPENDFKIQFRRTSGVDPTYEDSTQTITLNAQTFENACSTLAGLVKAQAEQSYFPYGFQFEGGGRGNVFRTLGESTITMTASTVMRIQNTTMADSGTGSTARYDTNPLKGKLYKTRGFVPYVRPSVTHNNSSLTAFHESPEHGINHAITVGDSSFMNHPPVGTSFFRYCTGSRIVKMQSGSIMPVRSYFKTKMTVLNYFKKISVSGANWNSHPNMFGSCTTLALEQSMRSENDESVTVGINREITMKAHVRLRTKVPTIHSYTSTGDVAVA